MLRLRPLLLALALCALPLLGAPGRAYAVPTMDSESAKENAVHLLERMGDWYMQAVEWRRAMNSKAEKMFQRTQQVMTIRRKYEAMAEGEMARLGEGIPDWRDYANYCAVDVDGVTVCNAFDKMMGKYEGLITNNFLAMQDKFFTRMDSVEVEVNSVIAGEFSKGTEWAEQKFVGSSMERRVATQPYLSSQAQTGRRLENASSRIQALVDSIAKYETDSTAISSGRAAQLTAQLSYAEAEINLEVARARLENLQLTTLRAADDIADYRLGIFSQSQAVNRW